MMLRGYLLAVALLAGSSQALAGEDVVLVPSPDPGSIADLRGRALADAQAKPVSGSLDAAPDQRPLRQHSRTVIGAGDFTLRATVTLDAFDGRGAGLVFDGGAIVLDDASWGAVLTGRLFGGGSFALETERPGSARPGAPLDIEVSRLDGNLIVRINEFEMGRIGLSGFTLGRIGFDLGAGSMRVLACSASGDLGTSPRPFAVFTGADGDIDEYRDPAIAEDAGTTLVAAIAVSTRDDGSTAERVWTRTRSGGAFGTARPIDLGAVEPDLIALGYLPGAARPWLLLVQPESPNRLADELIVFDSADGEAFRERSRVRSPEGRLRIVSGAMQQGTAGSLIVGATRLEGGRPTAIAIELGLEGSGSIRRVVDAPGCDPVWLGPDLVLVRAPGEMPRTLIRQRPSDPALSKQETGITSTRFEGSAMPGAAIGSAGSLRLAQADPSFPYPLREIGSLDGGTTWTRLSTLWGGSAGHATSVRQGGLVTVLFEGGDRARREHVLMVELPESGAGVTAPKQPQPESR